MGISELEIRPGIHGQKPTVRGPTKFEKFRTRKLFKSWTKKIWGSRTKLGQDNEIVNISNQTRIKKNLKVSDQTILVQ